MLVNKILHYFPDAEWAWASEDDYSTLEWFGPGNKPTEPQLNALQWPPAPPSEAEIEESAARVADEILDGPDEKAVAMALATVDLVIAARDGDLAGRTRAQIIQAYKGRIVDNLKARPATNPRGRGRQ